MARSRTTLTRDAVVAAAVEVADRDGADAVTVRRVAEALGSSPMALYHHVDGKDALLDAMVDAVHAELATPRVDLPWIDALAERCRDLHRVLLRHPWAVPLLDNRTSPGPATLGHLDALLGVLYAAGLSAPVIAHAVALLDAFVFGFVVQETSLPGTDAEGLEDVVASALGPTADTHPHPHPHPHMVRFAAEHVLRPDYRFDASFEVGLALLLDGLRELAAGAG
ncbi:MAG: TetR/AcrR family transcriptional regulator [Actinomycetes bacterium]